LVSYDYLKTPPDNLIREALSQLLLVHTEIERHSHLILFCRLQRQHS
jgi:hypothetical protein